MEVLQTHEKFSDYDADVFFGHEARFQKVATATSGTVFHNDPEIGTFEVRTIVLGHIRRVETRENRNLLYNVVYFVLGVLHIDNLDGNGLPGAFVNTGGEASAILLTDENAR